MASLYDEEWRQGTIFEAALPLDAVVLGESSGQPERLMGTHGRWVLATQDCDLDQTDKADTEPSIELRPVFTKDPPQDWGIRSARLLLTEQEYVQSASPRPVVSAAILTALKASGIPVRQIDPSRKRAYTTWLGKRYDRPAVPPELLPIARKIADTVKARRNRAAGAKVRDVLMQFGTIDGQIRYSLFAVLDQAADEPEVRVWLSDIALQIPPELGVADQIEAATAQGISLELVETAYSADITQLTWRPNTPSPHGAVM
ncbi:hypothetical protein [Trebonia sp.]|uniref:hypothetical protein n=1 Tax=Trebonia sp. TaxID=2767075 RepID=UPI00260E21A0|nr:hypothetical protein [Trebonia sp.]